jgi:ABC-type phosphate transport system substrate-binding protein
MSRTLESRWSRLTLAAVLSSAALLALAAPRSEAAFTIDECEGSDIIGRGASFARDAHFLWRTQFTNSFCSSVGTAPIVNYEALGSGAGRRVMGERTGSNADGSQSRNQTPRFGMTDEAPAPTRMNEMNRGTGPLDADDGDEGDIHVVPAAVGAVAALVNMPAGCDPASLADAHKTPDQNTNPPSSAPDDVVRVKFTKTEFEKLWASDADMDEWDEVFPEVASGGANPDADCDKQIIRVVRFDESGTTFAFKDFLDRLNPSRDWNPGLTGSDNRRWPNDGGIVQRGTRTDCGPTVNGPGPLPDDQDQLTSGCANGNGPLVEKLKVTDGSVGYSDISTARSAGLAIEPETNDNDTFWVPVQKSDNTYQEPTSDPNGFRTDGAKGANCETVNFGNNGPGGGLPADTFSDWSAVSGADTTSDDYGICTPTYGLVFDDNAPAYSAGNPDEEELKARTVKDYWTSLLSNASQGILTSGDYSPLPGFTPGGSPPAGSMLAIARAGINSVGWDKAGGGNGGGGNGGGGGGGGGGTGGGGGGGGGGGPAPAPAAPSNQFSVTRGIINSRRGTITLVLRLPGPGTLTVRGNGLRGVGRNVSAAGTVRITLRANRAGLRRLRRRGRMRTRLRVTFTPRGGTPRTSTRTVTLRLRR